MIRMKRVAGVVLVGAGAWAVTGEVLAGPDASPSARAAARLKHRPPQGWINHYLPDDRYKIKGGVWRFVSTETDDRYYHPDSPYMLSQPPGIVIGFANEAAAQEAGYRPGPGVFSQVGRVPIQPRPLSRRGLGTETEPPGCSNRREHPGLADSPAHPGVHPPS